MIHRVTIMEVRVRLDPVPGWGFKPEDHVKFLQDTLNSQVPWYHPEVKLLRVEDEHPPPEVSIKLHQAKRAAAKPETIFADCPVCHEIKFFNMGKDHQYHCETYHGTERR